MKKSLILLVFCCLLVYGIYFFLYEKEYYNRVPSLDPFSAQSDDSFVRDASYDYLKNKEKIESYLARNKTPEDYYAVSFFLKPKAEGQNLRAKSQKLFGFSNYLFLIDEKQKEEFYQNLEKNFAFWSKQEKENSLPHLVYASQLLEQKKFKDLLLEIKKAERKKWQWSYAKLYKSAYKFHIFMGVKHDLAKFFASSFYFLSYGPHLKINSKMSKDFLEAIKLATEKELKGELLEAYYVFSKILSQSSLVIDRIIAVAAEVRYWKYGKEKGLKIFKGSEYEEKIAALKEKKRCLKVLFSFDYGEDLSFFRKTLFYLFPSRIIKRVNSILEKIILRRDEYQKFVSSEKGQKLLKENKCSL